MNERQMQLVKSVDNHRQLILDAERWIWQHPETGFKEWQTNAYLTDQFETLGYNLVQAGNIPGFYTDVDTGKPGPKVCIMGELDALDMAGHPEAVNGNAHACGHHCQAAALLGIAAALKEPGILDGLSGSIRLMAVPAEEMIELGYREELRRKDIIRYMGGKVEFMARGYLDDVDLAFMVHTGGGDKAFGGRKGHIGCLAKTVKYKGKNAHAGGAPWDGINAQYAATLGLAAINSLRETFHDEDSIRVHPILKGATCAVNIIPDEMVIESYVRGRTMEAIKRENIKVNRALAGAALAMGAGVELCDRPGYSPEINDVNIMRLAEKCCIDLAGADRVRFNYEEWSTGSSDFGDITCVMPGVQFVAGGAEGHGHGIDYCIVDPERACVGSAKAQLFLADALLRDDAAAARDVMNKFKPMFPSIKEYFKALDMLFLDQEAVIYDVQGHASVTFGVVEKE